MAHAALVQKHSTHGAVILQFSKDILGFVGGTDSGRGEERMGGSCCLLHSFTPTYLQEYICSSSEHNTARDRWLSTCLFIWKAERIA